MAEHEVTLTVPPRKIHRADVAFEIRQDGELFGTLAVSQGTLAWFPRDAQYGQRMRWGKFDALMEEHATRYEKRSRRKPA